MNGSAARGAAAFTLAILLLGPTSAPGQEDLSRPGHPPTLLQEGNRLYQGGDYAGALETYEAVQGAGYGSGDFFYNLGNAYFKTGDLGRSILSYERALRLAPRDPDALANLELAKSLTADEIEPLPRFWVLSAFSWWTDLLPRNALVITVVLSYLLAAAGLCIRILSRSIRPRRAAGWLAVGASVSLLLFGSTLLAREGMLGGTEWGIILVEEVAVQSAPSDDDDLTLFHVHEGTKIRLDQHTDSWSEIVLEDGKVGWVPSGVFETI